MSEPNQPSTAGSTQPSPARARRSDRVDFPIRIEVEGIDSNGHSFWESARTVRVSRHGASIRLPRKLITDEELCIINLENGRKADVRVIGKICEGPDGFVYGVAFLDANENLWDITFPPMTEAEKSASRLLLECSKCHAREVSYLDEIETEVFHAGRSLPRKCATCRDSTTWRESLFQQASPAPPVPSPQKPRAPEPVTKAAVERRRHWRIRMRMVVCVRRAGHPDEFVESMDVSRGGLSFESTQHYSLGDRVEVATHYRKGAPSIFIASRIVHVKQIEGNLFLYGVCYLDAMQAQIVR